MNTVFEKFKQLNIDTTPISLEQPEYIYPYFCYPTNAVPIGFEGCIMYCFIKPCGDMVFAVNPESCADTLVYPLANSFEDFVKLILACTSANPVEQIVWMNKEQFEQHLCNEKNACTENQKTVLDIIAKELSLSPMENPYEYVKAVQAGFDGSHIEYSDEYYDVLGLERE
ncbi:MAG: hypothetical protein IIV99_01535 [Oscillospiraceae bacterium]|nr:hypothetical protein [Oscillospiraceae bacterium]